MGKIDWEKRKKELIITVETLVVSEQILEERGEAWSGAHHKVLVEALRVICDQPRSPYPAREAAEPNSYTCPFCKRRSGNPRDVIEQYCACCGSADESLPQSCGHREAMPLTGAQHG
jgi:hypothetical protein